MIEFITKNKESYCILDGEKISTQEVVNKMIDIILKRSLASAMEKTDGIQRSS